MAGKNQYGRQTRVFVGHDNPAVAVGGETSLSWKRQNQDQDISDKDGGAYGATSYGQQKITFGLSGNLKLPDAGFAALFAASKATPPEIYLQVKTGAVVNFAGMVAVGNFSAEFPTNGPATFSCDMANAGAPDTDDLTAAGNAGA